jgi:hypothetical protein
MQQKQPEIGGARPFEITVSLIGITVEISTQTTTIIKIIRYPDPSTKGTIITANYTTLISKTQQPHNYPRTALKNSTSFQKHHAVASEHTIIVATTIATIPITLIYATAIITLATITTTHSITHTGLKITQRISTTVLTGTASQN